GGETEPGPQLVHYGGGAEEPPVGAGQRIGERTAGQRTQVGALRPGPREQLGRQLTGRVRTACAPPALHRGGAKRRAVGGGGRYEPGDPVLGPVDGHLGPHRQTGVGGDDETGFDEGTEREEQVAPGGVGGGQRAVLVPVHGDRVFG